MRLGMGVALSVVGLLLRVRWEHALLVGLLGPLLVGNFLARSIRRRRPRPNAGQESLEIVGGGHFCRSPWMTGDLRTKLELYELSEALFREEEMMERGESPKQYVDSDGIEEF